MILGDMAARILAVAKPSEESPEVEIYHGGTVQVLGTDGEMHHIYPGSIKPGDIDDQGRLKIAEPPEPPSPWPLDLGYETRIYPREDEDLFIISGAQGGRDWMYASPGGMARLRNALVADASTAEKDALLVALCEERGIDLNLLWKYMPQAKSDGRTFTQCEIKGVDVMTRLSEQETAIRAVLENAKQTGATA